MTESSFNVMIVVSSIGLALMLMGIANFVLAARSSFVRVPILIVCASCSALPPIFFATGPVALVAVGGVSIGFLGLFALGSNRFASAFQAVSCFIRRPVGQGIVLGSCGLVSIAGAYIYFSIAEADTTDRDMALVAELASTPPLHTSLVATTDAGRSISLWSPDTNRPVSELSGNERKLLGNMGYSERLIRTSPASDVCNCHGWVFASGKYWVSPDDIDRVLQDNGYQPVSDPRPGDLAIYRQNGAVVHSAIVRISGEGSQTFVEGKWGWMGVFLHRVDDSSYGKQYTFYRGARTSHVLAGTDAQPSDVKRQTDETVSTPVSGR